MRTAEEGSSDGRASAVAPSGTAVRSRVIVVGVNGPAVHIN